MSSETPLFTPPRVFSKVKFHRHTDRTIGWLELFYDLVYVATLIQIGNFLSSNLDLTGFSQFLVLMVVVWWAWLGETFYENRFVVNDWFHRVLVFSQISAVAIIGLSVTQAFGDLYVQFTLAYVATRLTLVLMYLRAMRSLPEYRAVAGGYALVFSVGAAIWFASLFLPAGYQWVGWLVGVGIELLLPFLPFARRQDHLDTDMHHIAERFGIFTIIVLGESFVKLLDEAQGTVVGVDQLIFGALLFAVLFSLWWLYFSETAGIEVDFRSFWEPNAWVYGHLPLAIGLVSFGVVAKKLYVSTISYPGEAINPDYRLLLMAALIFYLVGLTLIELGLEDTLTIRKQIQKALLHLVVAGIILVVGLALTNVSTTAFVAIMAGIMLIEVAFDVFQTRYAVIHDDAVVAAH